MARSGGESAGPWPEPPDALAVVVANTTEGGPSTPLGVLSDERADMPLGRRELPGLRARRARDRSLG